MWVVVYFFYLVWGRFVALVSFAMDWLVLALFFCVCIWLIMLAGCDLVSGLGCFALRCLCGV